jgi:hypothetical protein
MGNAGLGQSVDRNIKRVGKGLPALQAAALLQFEQIRLPDQSLSKGDRHLRQTRRFATSVDERLKGSSFSGASVNGAPFLGDGGVQNHQVHWQ